MPFGCAKSKTLTVQPLILKTAPNEAVFNNGGEYRTAQAIAFVFVSLRPPPSYVGVRCATEPAAGSTLITTLFLKTAPK